MKRFLLVFGILLCMQCCAFPINLYDLGNGHYADLDSLRTDGDYGYVVFVTHLGNSRFKLLVLAEFDLLNYKAHFIKDGVLDENGKIVDIDEEFELPQFAREWRNVPQNSYWGEIIEMLKNLEH